MAPRPAPSGESADVELSRKLCPCPCGEDLGEPVAWTDHGV